LSFLSFWTLSLLFAATLAPSKGLSESHGAIAEPGKIVAQAMSDTVQAASLNRLGLVGMVIGRGAIINTLESLVVEIVIIAASAPECMPPL